MKWKSCNSHGHNTFMCTRTLDVISSAKSYHSLKFCHIRRQVAFGKHEQIITFGVFILPQNVRMTTEWTATKSNYTMNSYVNEHMFHDYMEKGNTKRKELCTMIITLALVKEDHHKESSQHQFLNNNGNSARHTSLCSAAHRNSYNNKYAAIRNTGTNEVPVRSQMRWINTVVIACREQLIAFTWGGHFLHTVKFYTDMKISYNVLHSL